MSERPENRQANARANEALRRGVAPKLTVERPIVQTPEHRALNAFIRRSMGREELAALEAKGPEPSYPRAG
jgi:hypothetical protein